VTLLNNLTANKMRLLELADDARIAAAVAEDYPKLVKQGKLHEAIARWVAGGSWQPGSMSEKLVVRAIIRDQGALGIAPGPAVVDVSGAPPGVKIARSLRPKASPPSGLHVVKDRPGAPVAKKTRKKAKPAA
jgi:hypothetical protein